MATKLCLHFAAQIYCSSSIFCQVSLEVGTSLQKTPCHNLVHNQTLLNEVFPETPTILSTLQEYRDRGAVSYQTHFQHCLATALAQAVSFSILTGCDLNDELFENFSKLKFGTKLLMVAIDQENYCSLQEKSYLTMKCLM